MSLVTHQLGVLASYFKLGRELPAGLAKLRPRTVALVQLMTQVVGQVPMTDEFLVLVRWRVGEGSVSRV